MAMTDLILSIAVLTGAFWLLIRHLPAARVPTKAALGGALTAAVLFAVGKHLIGLYIARAGVASAYGAAGSFVVVVLWIYYSAQIVLLGAEVARTLGGPTTGERENPEVSREAKVSARQTSAASSGDAS